MGIESLKYKLEPNENCDLQGETKFVYNYGLFNCKILKFKDANTVIKIMNEYDGGILEKHNKEFIVKNSHKEVLCYICDAYGDSPDVFVYNDGNIAFRVECFV